MAKTRHMQQRMSQRSIQQSWLELVKTFGTDDGDKVKLNRDGIDRVLKEMKDISANLQKMRSRGGIVLVESAGHEITTYSMDSYKNINLH
jgi:hypothetical protein